MRFLLHAAFAFTSVALVAQLEAGERRQVTSADKVKATATATKPDADGKQTVTITLDIEKGWLVYANPVNHNHEFLDENKVRIRIKAKESVGTNIKYPTGRIRRVDKDRFNVYEGIVTIEANVVRVKSDSSPLEISIYVQAEGIVCILPGKIKLTVR